MEMPAISSIHLNYHFQCYLMKNILVHQAFVVSVMRETRSGSPMDMALYTGRMKKRNYSVMAIEVCFALRKQHFFLGYLYQLSFISVLCHFTLTLKNEIMYSAEILCVTSADMFYTISSHSVRFFHIYYHSHLTLFIFQSLLLLKSFYCSFYTASDYFDLMSEVPHRFFYFQLTWANWCLQHVSSSLPAALPTGTPIAVCCLGHIASELLLYTLVSDFYPWLNFTHAPVQFSEEHLKNATEKVYIF